jgi:hypothetical protein
MPLRSSFSNRDLLDYTTNTWKDSGALAGKYGYSLGLSLQFNINGWLGLSVGYQHFSLPFSEEKLMLQIKNFLGNNGVNYGMVVVSSDAYRLHLIYGTLAIGTFRNKKIFFKVEPLIGEVRTDLLWNNSLDVQVNSHTGQSIVSAFLPLKYEPFLVYGGKATIQLGFGKYGNVRFQLSGEYLQGKSNMSSQQIQFNNLPGSIIIPAPDLRLIGVNLGFHFTLNNPQK